MVEEVNSTEGGVMGYGRGMCGTAGSNEQTWTIDTWHVVGGDKSTSREDGCSQRHGRGSEPLRRRSGWNVCYGGRKGIGRLQGWDGQ